MKCPKCGYLGFEQVDRCRNCGYEFSLTQQAPTPDLALRERQRSESNPLDDLSFLKDGRSPVASQPATTADLPLFVAPAVDDQPLITKASPPRPPLAVRRATPEVHRLRAEPRPQSFDLGFELESPASAPVPIARRRAAAAHADVHRSEVDSGTAGQDEGRETDARLGARFVAVAIDLTILFIVDLLVVYFTMQICGVGLLEFGVLPKAPLLAFLAVENGGYLVGFTAGGQTLGKMAVGIRVVTADEAESLNLGRAAVRTVFWCTLAIPLGLGFLTVLTGDHRGLHDRVAGTRVVRASA